MGEDSPKARYAAEFIGTFFLVFTIGCNVLSGQPVWGGVSIACVLTVMIYALGKSSGANFNPAVSVALCISGKLEQSEAVIYCIVQVLGGLFASACYKALFKSSFTLHPTNGHTMQQAAFAELLYTFMLCFVVLNVAASKFHAGKNQFYGIAIGFVIVAGAYSGGSVSGGCFNPAVAIGIDLLSTKEPTYNGSYVSFVYTFFEMVGAVLAAGAFQVCRGDQENEDEDEIHPAEPSTHAKLLSEFLGTYMLVLTVGLNVLSGSAAGAFSIAAALMCMIFAFGTVSGAHFNPAVTIALICSGRNKCSPSEGSLYIVVQVLAGILAAFTYSRLMNGESFALKPAASAWTQVFVAEFIFTFVLAFVVLSVASVKSVLTEYFGFVIGMCVTVGGCAIGKVSGGSLNPAVSIGIAASHDALSGGGFSPGMVYTIAEVLGGVAAAGIFMLTQPSEYEGLPKFRDDISIATTGTVKCQQCLGTGWVDP